MKSKFLAFMRIIAPKGSALDTIFDSYDDWRIAREEAFAKQAAKSPTAEPPRAEHRGAEHRGADDNPSPK